MMLSTSSTLNNLPFIAESTGGVAQFNGGAGADVFKVQGNAKVKVDDYWLSGTRANSAGDLLVLADATGLDDITHEALADGTMRLRVMSTGAQVDITQIAGSHSVESVQLPLAGSTYTMAELLQQTADATQPVAQARAFSGFIALSMVGVEYPVSLGQFASAGTYTGTPADGNFADLVAVPVTDVSEYASSGKPLQLMPTTPDSQLAANDPMKLGLLIAPAKKATEFDLLQA